ncbi:MAG: hypothetical protein KME31_31115 [Tolypothrix carrinoi HA7290-LM1]|nr:hypothetical protein [Tolypothrix carrinoi HA7290-LM1]
MRSHFPNTTNAIALSPINPRNAIALPYKPNKCDRTLTQTTRMRIAIPQHHKCVVWLFIIRANFFSQIGTGSEVFF